MKRILVYAISIVLASFVMMVNAQTLPTENIVRSTELDSASQMDVNILNGAIALLVSESVWNKQDDIVCTDDERSGIRSLYCALHQSSVDVLGEYKHDSVAMQEVRNAILQRTDYRRFAHSLRDFNNMSSTTFTDVKEVLQSARESVINRLSATTNPGRPEV